MPSENDKLELRYVPLEQAVLWDKNPKRHDYGAIVESIKKYGFKDPPKFEPRLNGDNGTASGGIVEGNGRVTCLLDMRMNGEPRPRGILGEGNEWLVPILFGVDAESREAAMGYALDHNALTLLGGDFGMYDLAKLYEEDIYANVLRDLQNADMPPVSMNYDDIGAFLNTVGNNGNFDTNKEWEGMPEFEQEDLTAFQSIHVHFKNQEDINEFANLIHQNITPKTRSIWYPGIEIETYADKRYSDES